MFSVLLTKELKAIVLSPKFAATLGVCTVLMLLSVWIGIREYHASLRQYDAAQQLNDQETRQQTSWARFESKAFRPPNPMQVFVSGVTYDVGRWSEISGSTPIKLEGSVYSDDPIFALFRYFDFAFVVQFVFSLLAILFTYDSICGERESGTLKLVFSNSVPKAQYLLAKATGAVTGLIVPILLPILAKSAVGSCLRCPVEHHQLGGRGGTDRYVIVILLRVHHGRSPDIRVHAIVQCLLSRFTRLLGCVCSHYPQSRRYCRRTDDAGPELL